MVPRDKKTTFPAKFRDEYCTAYSNTKKNHIQAQNKTKNKTKYLPFQTGGQIPIFISRHFNLGKNLKKKKHFPQIIFP